MYCKRPIIVKTSKQIVNSEFLFDIGDWKSRAVCQYASLVRLISFLLIFIFTRQGHRLWTNLCVERDMLFERLFKSLVLNKINN